ncbi:MAG: M23 family metallopeptidase, partial [Dolichospermum sp.]
MATGEEAINNLAGSLQPVVSGKAGKQLEQGVREAFANPIGFLKKVYKVDVGFVENSRSSMDSYPGHIGDDIFAPIGSRIFAPLPGTVVQSREGGTRNTDDANPLVPGYQPQQLVIIKLDMPIEFEGRKITHLNMRHLLSRNVKVGQKVKMGDLLGTVGEAGGRGTQFGTKNPGTPRDADAAHLHIEYSPAENNQRDSLPDAIASRLTAKLSQAFSAAQLPVPATRQRQPVPAMSVPQPTQTTKQKQQEYKNEQNLWQRFTNW